MMATKRVTRIISIYIPPYYLGYTHVKKNTRENYILNPIGYSLGVLTN
jgi:hypothetical protein